MNCRTEKNHRLKHIDMGYGPVAAVNGIAPIRRAGSFFALPSPAGCGGTTLLRIIAGLQLHPTFAVRFPGTASILQAASRRSSSRLPSADSHSLELRCGGRKWSRCDRNGSGSTNDPGGNCFQAEAREVICRDSDIDLGCEPEQIGVRSSAFRHYGVGERPCLKFAPTDPEVHNE